MIICTDHKGRGLDITVNLDWKPEDQPVAVPVSKKRAHLVSEGQDEMAH